MFQNNKRAGTKLEIADIFNKYHTEYINKYQPPIEQLKVISAIKACRTEVLGTQTYACQDCGSILHVYHSCRNRHCPKCQGNARQKWLEERKNELLPVKYFHLVFTVPASLNQIALFNKRLFYGVLFSAVNQTLSAFSNDCKWLGAQYGAISILHTWGQNLSFHPHIHLVIPAGGISEDKMEWKSTRRNFFAPVKAMSITFRNNFCTLLKAMLTNCYNQVFADELNSFFKLIDTANEKAWVVFAQKPFEKPQYVIDYLGNYTHRVAISNHRLIKLENDMVSFYYKDYKQGGQRKIMKLSALEFIRRFLQHVLPLRFCKIRYFGFLSNRFKNKNLAIAREALSNEQKGKVVMKESIESFFKKITFHVTKNTCSCCGGKMVQIYHENTVDEKRQENSS